MYQAPHRPDPRDVTLRYLLIVGGSDGRRARTSASVFAAHDEAEDEFGRLQGQLARDGWVELASVDDQGRLRRLRRSTLTPAARTPR